MTGPRHCTPEPKHCMHLLASGPAVLLECSVPRHRQCGKRCMLGHHRLRACPCSHTASVSTVGESTPSTALVAAAEGCTRNCSRNCCGARERAMFCSRYERKTTQGYRGAKSRAQLQLELQLNKNSTEIEEFGPPRKTREGFTVRGLSAAKHDSWAHKSSCRVAWARVRQRQLAGSGLHVQPRTP